MLRLSAFLHRVFCIMMVARDGGADAEDHSGMVGHQGSTVGAAASLAIADFRTVSPKIACPTIFLP